jgi:hypothetical protein
LRFIKEAPQRVAGAVGQDPVGYAEGVNSRATYFAMFEPTIALAQREGMAAVVAAAVKDPTFVRNNAAGPFAARLAAEPAFREELLKLTPAEYERLIRAYDEQLWGADHPFISVEEAFVKSCPAPLLILPGHDPFHPTPISERICREAPQAHCLDVDCRAPEKIEATKQAIRQFLREHARRASAVA